jgi:hypothetical protein
VQGYSLFLACDQEKDLGFSPPGEKVDEKRKELRHAIPKEWKFLQGCSSIVYVELVFLRNPLVIPDTTRRKPTVYPVNNHLIIQGGCDFRIWSSLQRKGV